MPLIGLNSDDLWGREGGRERERHEAQGLRVLPLESFCFSLCLHNGASLAQ